MHGFKSAILAEWKNCQNGTFEPVREIQNFFWLKDFFWGIVKVPFTKISITFSMVCQIQDLGRSKYKLRLFSKRTHRILKDSFYSGFLWICNKPGKQNWKPFFWVFIIVKKQCDPIGHHRWQCCHRNDNFRAKISKGPKHFVPECSSIGFSG